MEAYYLEERPELDEGPFLKEERNLIDGIAGTLAEAIEHKEAEEALRESEERYRIVLETMTDAVGIIGQDGTLLFVNEGLCQQYGYAREEVIGMATAELIRPDHHPVLGSFMKQISDTGRFSGETIDRRKDGTEFSTEVRGSGIRFRGRECLLAVVRDVSERKEAERIQAEHTRELAGVNRELEARNAELQEALEEIKTLRGFLPVCSYCKKLRSDEGFWEQVDTYLQDKTEAQISHGICPDCVREHFPGFWGDTAAGEPGEPEEP